MPPLQQQPDKVDFRIYIGLLVFRWQVIAVCFLWSMLCGVIYIQATPKKFKTYCYITVYRDRNLTLPGSDPTWTSLQLHRQMLTDGIFGQRIASSLLPVWGETMGGVQAMLLNTVVRNAGGLTPTFEVSAESGNGDYAKAYLSALISEHEKEWKIMQKRSSEEAGELLEEELARLDEKIKQAEDDVIEYQRLHDMARVSARGNVEAGYLNSLIGRRHQLSTELMMLESQNPELKNEGIGVISAVSRLTRDTGKVGPEPEVKDIEAAKEVASDDGAVTAVGSVAPTAEGSVGPEVKRTPLEDKDAKAEEEVMGWPKIRVQLARLKAEETELLKNLTADHPRIKAIRKETGGLENQMDIAASIQLENLKDRHRALTIQLKAIEAAEYRWQARDMYTRQRRAEFARVSSQVARFQNNYNTLYTRLHEMRVNEELKAERFDVKSEPRTNSTPIWPDPLKILLVSLVVGIGSGAGLVVALQVFDNKIQTIKDVEETLGVPFLGGVPFWVHSGLDRVIRPIVTEEHSSGAIEAYRALRTSILSALGKANEKILLVTSADSREGKTLTALNLAIMIAQMDKRVLLADMDLRRGRLHRSLGVRRDPGITDALKEDRSLREIITGTRIDGLFLAPAGSGTENAAEILESCDLLARFVEIQDDYDYIIVDTSPVLRVTDTSIMARQGLGILVFVARVNHTPKPLIKYALDMLKDSRVLGLIMNSIEMHKISSLYYSYQYPNYAYYSNAYAYGYDHYYTDRPTGVGGRRGKRRSLKNRVMDALDKAKKSVLPGD